MKTPGPIDTHKLPGATAPIVGPQTPGNSAGDALKVNVGLVGNQEHSGAILILWERKIQVGGLRVDYVMVYDVAFLIFLYDLVMY